ncbi:MAG: DUF3417 domain-containing protein, partial [Proteobacteria bacterium]|nr:DUF3417 domain-containing protein [Pseudomonadota bacterium]
DYQDAVESQALYNVLSEEVIPCFYDRKNGDAPRLWVAKMKASIKMVMQHFCSHVMVSKYNDQFYVPSGNRLLELISDNLAEAKSLTLQRERLRSLWKFIKLDPPVRKKTGHFRVGDTFNVTSEVFLGEIKPEEVEVQLYFGKMKSVDSLTTGGYVSMKAQEDLGNGRYVYGCDVACSVSGRFGFTARATPKGDGWIKNTPELLTWA